MSIHSGVGEVYSRGFCRSMIIGICDSQLGHLKSRIEAIPAFTLVDGACAEIVAVPEALDKGRLLSARLGLCMNNLTAFSRTFCNLKGIVFAKQRSVGLVVVVPMCWLSRYSIPKGACETATVPEIMQHCGPCSKSSRRILS